ncbi:MAG: hypothetical protein DWQ04_18140 [Chloroflexi bacterium]|nr:MAG: hypothetical protein DWQ04_18140 [Chloroflexota bacterium]
MFESEVGTRIGKYEIKKQIVKEATRSLYLATDESNQPLLLEIYECEFINSAASHLKTLHKIPSTQIVEIFATPEGQPVVAYPFTHGQRLSDLLSENPAALTTEQSLRLVHQLTTLLAAAQEKEIFHKDIHPENIWIIGKDTAVFIGWGLQDAVPDRPIPTNELGYTAPELNKKSAHTAQSNIFSLGVLLFTLLAHHPPQFETDWDIFTKGEKTQIILLENARTGLTKETYQLVRHCLWRQPWSRYDNIQEFLTAVEIALAAESPPVDQKKSSIPLPPLSIPSSSWKPVIIAISTLLILGLVFLFFWGPLASTDKEPNNTAVPALIAPEETGTKTAVPLATQTLATQTSTPVDNPDNLVEPEKPTTTSRPNTNTPAPTPSKTSLPTHTPTATQTNTTTATPAETSTLTPTIPPTATETDACIPFQPEGWIIYTVQADDYLFNLATQSGTTVAFVQEINCLTGDSLSIGQTIFLPAPPIVNSPTPEATSDSGNNGGNQPGNSQPNPTSRPSRPTKTPPPP